MAEIGAAANIIAAIQLSAKVASLCLEYSRAVKNAKTNTESLQRELNTLETTLQGAQRLLESPNGSRLQTSQRLLDGLYGCKSQLKDMEKKLEETLNVGRRQKVMSRLGIRALKWPFESRGVNDIITTLRNNRDELTTALNIDQTGLILDIDQTLVLSKLLTAKGAAFDSHTDEHDARCHPGTRVALLQDITKWAENYQGECVFWLNGMAGTGKSTISRTVAQSFANKEVLGGSFFFKRGEQDRGNAALLFTTIAAQLITKIPTLATFVRDAINADPALPERALKEQFKNLIWKPLESLKGDPTNPKRIVLVVDALDECERDEDVKVIIHLLSQVRTLTSVQLRTFVTSRPELSIRLGFNSIDGQYQGLVLHEIPKPIIEHDIAAFLEYKLKEIRDEYNGLSSGDRQLPSSWPGTEAIQTLVQMAVPLFIFAATTCRFINDDPASRLNEVLNYRSMTKHDEFDQLNATYRPVLDRLIAGKKEAAKRSLVAEFRTVVGSIVLLAEPLSTASLANLLNIARSGIDRRLTSLHSVLSVPASTESPVRIFHLSFRDFLVDRDKRDTNPFWIDERETHGKIANRCLELLSSGDGLRQDICNLDMPGMARADVEPAVINSHLPADVRYACLYWVYHLGQSRPAEDKACITDDHQAYAFLKRHFLHWLEALSLLGKISESIAMIGCLQSLISSENNAGVTSFLRDASRFILNSRSIIDICPVQAYSSTMIFAPERSVIRNTFQEDIPDWISVLPKVDLEWSACRQTIEGHGGSVNAVTFSPDGKTVASGSSDYTVRFWDAATGEERQKLEGHGGSVNAVAFSPDGKTVASGSSDYTVRLWDAATGEERQKLEGHGNWVKAVAFSPDGKMVASGSGDNTVQLWDAATGEERQKLEGHGSSVWAVAFSPDGETVASGSWDNTVRLWDAATGEERQKLEGRSGSVNAVAFSPDGKTVASGSDDGTVRLWDAATGEEMQKLEGHGNWVRAVAFSPDGKMVASGSDDGTVRLWDAATGEEMQKLEGHGNWVRAVAFSSDGKMVASGSWDNTVRLWDAATGEERQKLEGRSGSVNAVAFSPDGKTVASGLGDSTVRLWNAATGEEGQKLEGHSDWVQAVAFSPDGKTVASGSSDYTVRLWDAATGEEMQKLEGHSDWVQAVAFSPDGKTVASGSGDNTVRLWDAATGEEGQTLEFDHTLFSLSFSTDSRHLKTDRGIINLDLGSEETSSSPKTSGYSLMFGKDWVTHNGRRALWLPPDFRPSCMASHDNAFALGYNSGLVKVIRFTFS
ncbi:vegetative incompatibility protein HET-E-1 [Macrophomina phaseolina]|uniref:Mitochondrial division protein 1 n=1 Tax=Macrophomina phaseolina TaxID=35725 RepID=A0ABQ8FQQ6_9PEZI|nr:vegetative incompatibility protein HET-E-1 [Macrophomina phaseolina]